jgi:cell division protein FtsI/penicillin-binding protein 2
LAGKKTLYDYLTKHFGLVSARVSSRPTRRPGSVKQATNEAGNNVTYANMSFGQGMSVTMIQMVAAMAAVANGGTLVPAAGGGCGDEARRHPEIAASIQAGAQGVISKQTAAQLAQMLTVVVEHGSGYKANESRAIPTRSPVKTGTAQIPRPDGKGYIEGANIGSFVGYAPAQIRGLC